MDLTRDRLTEALHAFRHPLYARNETLLTYNSPINPCIGSLSGYGKASYGVSGSVNAFHGPLNAYNEALDTDNAQRKPVEVR